MTATMEKRDLMEMRALDIEELEMISGGVGAINCEEREDANLGNPLIGVLVTAAVFVVKSIIGSYLPDTFEEFYNNAYLAHKTAIDIAVCAAVGPAAAVAYGFCDKKSFWEKVYKALK